jgi:hypothetical protein
MNARTIDLGTCHGHPTNGPPVSGSTGTKRVSTLVDCTVVDVVEGAAPGTVDAVVDEGGSFSRPCNPS